MKFPKVTWHPEIESVITYELDSFEDHRGLNFEIYDPKNPHCLIPFNLDSCSVSKAGVLRGFHGDSINWKLIQCLYGSIQLYLIDTRRESSTYRSVKQFILNSSIPKQVLIPAGVVNAHLCLTDQCVFYYKWSDGYVPPSKQIHVKWNDPRFKLDWMIKKPTLSDRDK
jgi:dTDP-4-dehydrorhamnose 3,5-epimerase